MSTSDSFRDRHMGNLAMLRRMYDPHIKSIEAFSSHVFLYRFQSNGEWEKTEIEGCMLVYQREAEPFHAWVILGRNHGAKKFEFVTQQMDFHLKSPFLLYKNQSKQIFGILFRSRKDCKKVANKLISWLQEPRTDREFRTNSTNEQRTTDSRDEQHNTTGFMKRIISSVSNLMSLKPVSCSLIVGLLLAHSLNYLYGEKSTSNLN